MKIRTEEEFIANKTNSNKIRFESPLIKDTKIGERLMESDFMANDFLEYISSKKEEKKIKDVILFKKNNEIAMNSLIQVKLYSFNLLLLIFII